MLVQTAVVVLLAAAPALVQASPLSISTGVTALKKLNSLKHSSAVKHIVGDSLKHNSAAKHIVGAKPATKAKKHPGLKINTGARQSLSPIGTGRSGFGFGSTPYSGRYTPPFTGGGMASPYGGYAAQFTPTYASPTSYGGYPYSPQPIVSPGYSYVRRDAILSPRSELSPRALTSPPTLMSDMGALTRARIGLPGAGAPVLPSTYMRKGTRYTKAKAIHRNTDLEMLEGLLEQAERVVNGLEEQLNKPKTMFPELEAVTRKIKKMHATKLAAAAKLAAKPATPTKSG